MIVVADTGAMLALIDRRDTHHDVLRAFFLGLEGRWVLPWATLPEVDYLVARELGAKAHEAWLADLGDGTWDVEPTHDTDLLMAVALHERYQALRMGLVDSVVAVVAERLRADAIATLDLRHFGAMSLSRKPRLLPRDL